MATATDAAYASPTFSPSSSLSIARSPDTASPIYPERAIRPLPKSRLKSKLSPQQASTIAYPPDPPPISPTLQFSAPEQGGGGGGGAAVAAGGHAALAGPSGRMTNGHHGHHHHPHHQPQYEHAHEAVHSHCTCGEDADSGDDEVEFDHPDYRYLRTQGTLEDMTATATTANGRPLSAIQQRLLAASQLGAGKTAMPSGSTASSADGYESFENTSNKKKRKIPLSSATSVHQSQLSAEMASMGISQGDGALDEPAGGPVAMQQQPYPGAGTTAASGTGISGAGRGRYGRQNTRNDRRPLSTMNTVNGFAARIPSKNGVDVRNGHDGGVENSGGIISQAIRSAAEQGPLTPHKGAGKDSVSLLQSAASTGSPKTQFTFSCESESASKMELQPAAYAPPPGAGYGKAGAGYAPNTQYGTPTPAGVPLQSRVVNGQPIAGQKGNMSTHGTQTTPSLRGGPPQNVNGATRPPPPPNGTLPPGQQQQQGPPAPASKPPKPRRRPSKEYALAARQRQLQQEYTNYHHRPTKDNMWICEFCEYEDIFGEPPLAMIRKYEIKDRQERKKAAERRRLLEKAKMKNRKGKKGKGKGNNNNNANANNAAGAPPPPVNGQNYDPNLPPPDGEEYYDDDEYGDEYEPVGPDEPYDSAFYPPPPPPTTTPAVQTPGAGGGIPRAPPPTTA